MQQPDRAVNRIIARNGHKSLMGARWQSWGGFTEHLFHEAGPRREFDVLEARYSLDAGEVPLVEWKTDDESLTSAYFGRPLKVATCYLPRVPTTHECNYGCEEHLQELLDHLNPLLPRVYEEHGYAALHCDPILVMRWINMDKKGHHYLCANFLWQYKKKE